VHKFVVIFFQIFFNFQYIKTTAEVRSSKSCC